MKNRLPKPSAGGDMCGRIAYVACCDCRAFVGFPPGASRDGSADFRVVLRKWRHKTTHGGVGSVFIFGISYDWMNIVPNYTVNPVDVAGLYGAEKGLFGISTEARGVDPNEFFALHRNVVMDFMAEYFISAGYRCQSSSVYGYTLPQAWTISAFRPGVPACQSVGIRRYYIHPAAPPWYVAGHGFEAVVGTRGEVAGLGALMR